MFTQLLSRRRVRVFCDRGRVALDAGDFDLAAAHFAAALRLDPDHAAGYAGRGVALLKQWRFRAAIDEFSQALRLEPHSGFLFYCRGLAYAGAGHHDRARADYDRAQALDATIDTPAAAVTTPVRSRFQSI